MPARAQPPTGKKEPAFGESEFTCTKLISETGVCANKADHPFLTRRGGKEACPKLYQ